MLPKSRSGVDVVIDNLGGTVLAQSLEATRALGIVVLMVNVLRLETTIPMRSVFFPQKQIRGTLMGNVEELKWGLDQVRAGVIKPTLDRTFHFEDAAEAHEWIAKGKAVGNLVFEPR